MNDQIIIEKTRCYHCGDDCISPAYFTDEKHFCCQGCKSVYEILSASKLGNYYSYNDHPGINRAHVDKRFGYLNEPDIAKDLVDYKDDNITIVTFYIPQIHCSSCLWLLEQLNKMEPAIHYSRVDFLKKQLNIRFDHRKLNLRQLVELLYNVGYEPVISLQDIIKKQNAPNKDNLVQKIAVAGFCFGNVMLLSFPEYFGISVYEQAFKHFFGWANILFSLPVVLYSGREYFVSAWHNLRNRVLNIDFPLALGIGVLFARSVVDVLLNNDPGFTDTLCGLVFFLLIGKFIQKKTYYHISFERDYRSFFPVAVNVLYDDVERPVSLSQLHAGQRIVIRHNEIIPADAILLKGRAVVDFSFVTGEAEFVDKTLGEIIYAGGRQMGEAIELEVVKSVSQSYLTQLWNNEAFKRNKDNPIQTFNEKVSRYFTVALLAIAFGSLLFWLSSDYKRGLAAFTSVLIVACPCALALSTPFTMAAALSIFDKNLFYLKNTRVVEQMAAVDTIVMDKTGTITNGESNSIELQTSLTELQKQLIYSACTNSIHPLSRMICNYLGKMRALPVMTYREVGGQGIAAVIDKHHIAVGSGNMVKMDMNEDDNNTAVHITIDDKYLGCFAIKHNYRDGLRDITQLSAEYELYLLSGDNDKEKQTLLQFFNTTNHLQFNQTPQDKLDFIQSLQVYEHKVMMIGDGLNDSGALKQSDVGVAITDNVNNFSPGSDAILDGKSFKKLPLFLRFSKDAVFVVHISFIISLAYNLIGLSYAVTGNLSPLIAAILMPASTVTIISFTSIATHLFAKKRHLI
jgi:Cu+-exporting ATPase